MSDKCHKVGNLLQMEMHLLVDNGLLDVTLVADRIESEVFLKLAKVAYQMARKVCRQWMIFVFDVMKSICLRAEIESSLNASSVSPKAISFFPTAETLKLIGVLVDDLQHSFQQAI